jgi:4'-phosphopantetheinyl transferase
MVLSGYIQCAPPEVEIRSDDKGKPYVVDGAHKAALQFSMSHSAGLAVFAFGRCERIGIDIEEIRGFPEMLAVAALNFTSTEVEEIHAAPEENCASTFFKLWTRKEALLKASGDGVLLPLCCVDGSTPRGELRMWRKKIKEDSSGREYALMDVMVAPGFAAAVAACCIGNGFGISLMES